MARWRNEQTRRIMEYTRDMHGEFQSVRRVMEALNGALDDVEWFSIQTASLDPGGILEMPGMSDFQNPQAPWLYWLMMMTVGPPTVSGTHCVLRDRPELREAYCAHAGRVPGQKTMSEFLQRMAQDISCIRACLLDQAEIGAGPALSPERRLLADAADTGIMLLEYHQDLVMSGEPVGRHLQEKVATLRAFTDSPGSQDEPRATRELTREMITELAAIRDRVTSGQRLWDGMTARLSKLGETILAPMEDGDSSTMEPPRAEPPTAETP